MSEHSVRKQVLDAAAGAVLQDRAAAYGSVEDNFQRIADMWMTYIHIKYKVNIEFEAWDVANMMTLLKIARTTGNPTHLDSWVDQAGYAACGAEAAQNA